MDRISLGDYELEISYRGVWSSVAEAPSVPDRDMPTGAVHTLPEASVPTATSGTPARTVMR
jgi:hypothetical protein